MDTLRTYVDVIVPLPLDGVFTYAVPAEWAGTVQPGMRVVVPFGKRKMYTALICRVHTTRPERHEAKEVLALLDNAPILRPLQWKLWQWMASYYMAAPGDVYQAAVPAGMKPGSETRVRANADFEGDPASFTAREQRLLDLLADGKEHSVDELNRQAGMSNCLPALKKLMEAGAVEVSEELAQRFRPKTETCVRLAASAQGEDALRRTFDLLARAPKQLDLLMRYVDLSRCLTPHPQEVARRDLLEQAHASPATLAALTSRGVLEIYHKEIGRLDASDVATRPPHPLNPHQQEALERIESLFRDKAVVLLHGVTSSGKTELYIHLILRTLAEGKQVLYLVPEIALTTQLTSRLRQVLGNRLGVYHSKFSDAERVEIWQKVLRDGGYDVIIGVRSSVFLPFRQLGLVIVDEEHETSYKQFDPAPRYHARDTAIVLAALHGAHTLLGTATPAVETYHNALSGKYGLVELTRRHEDVALPRIVVADLKEAYRKKQMEQHFTPELVARVRQALAAGEQVILFQNRRGYAPMVECPACSYVPRCPHCDVSLTVHRALHSLTCHYCGYTEPLPTECPVCHTPGLAAKGFGTERIEDEIQALFPGARAARMDLDTTRSRKRYEQILADFEAHRVDILVGTQMVTKGLDFEHVSLVGILNADNLLNFPDFRAHERAYHLMAQVAGRAGRRGKQGTVVLQTSQPEHPVIRQVVANDYAALFRTQCAERQQFHYPPYVRLIRLSLRHRDAAVLRQAARTLGADMRAVFGPRVFGPNDPLVSRIQNLFIKDILLKIEPGASLGEAKQRLRQLANRLLSDPAHRQLRLSFDVDPM